jgi:hypothetical protein
VSRLLLYIGRLLIVLVGYLAGCLAASAFLNMLLVGGLDMNAEQMRWTLTGSVFVSVPILAVFIAYYGFVPAMAWMLLAEFTDKRDWLFHALGGGVAALAAVLMFSTPASAGLRLQIALVASGLVGGLAYWAISGRMAGSWRPEPISPVR